jgi:alkylation response protein AidB-like acyl-CoA dehydrogenase
MNEFSSSANMAFSMYPGLTLGAVAALLEHGSEEQKSLYVPPMVEGRWSGTMNLTEPHCGTDLGLIRRRRCRTATGRMRSPAPRSSSRPGEHDLTENIVHLVLARIEGAPEGTKGISLFVVPESARDAGRLAGRAQRRRLRLPRAQDGHPRQRDLRDELRRRHGLARGRGHRGLAAMFVMMNEARLGVAIQGLSQSRSPTRTPATYAKDRLQGRALTARRAREGR